LHWDLKHKARLIKAALVAGLNLTGWLFGTPLSLHADYSSQVGVFVHIVNPPNPVTDLSAAPVGLSDGDVQLNWTAPRNPNSARIDHYLVRYATTPAASAGNPYTWWNSQASSEQLIAPAHSPGSIEFTEIHGLSVGREYFFSIKSVDEDGSISPLDDKTTGINQAHSFPLTTGGSSPPSTPNNFNAIVLSTSAIHWTWDASATADFYVLSNPLSGTTVLQTVAISTTETGFLPNTAVTRVVKAGNGSGLSAPSNAITVHTLAQVPTNLTITNVGFTSISLSWSANTNVPSTFFNIERSQDGTNFSQLVSTAVLSFTDASLSEENTYYFRIRAINGDGVVSAPSDVVSAYTPRKVDFLRPKPPEGLKASLDPSGHAFTLLWEAPTENEDGSALNDLAGYNIYRRTTLFSTPIKITPNPVSITAFADRVDGRLYYYTIRAVDSSLNESADSLIADSSADTNIIYLSSDGVSHVMMPDSVNDLLRSAFNKYGVPLTLQLVEQPLPPNTDVVRNLRLQLVRTDNNQPIEEIAFAKPQATVAVGYNAINGQVGRGAPMQNIGVHNSGGTLAGVTPQDLSLFWFNGVTWVRIGGSLDVLQQVIKTKSSFLGSYQLRAQAATTSLSLSQGNVYPRLFTPNGDGLNDRVYFVLENPQNSSVEGEILDKAGRHVRALPPAALQTGIGTTLTWDGKDDHGVVVPGGAYIYKITGEGKTFTGSVGVAR
jgi:hypothetical protein